ncbi:activator of Hsp90 ATPase 1 family protein [Bacillus sp. MUM 116]|uniref:SRPBCC family protein n=1 Tax=Bacillus sp. MUM 116 TaxID=1678002 RepID=UPI0008F5D801|nr:SRPBCC family protein [Bacillus sp. MUM 116]OIK06060.1 activator of Hsp90 ATPase 1 family protein [Bacillus sp. MUM 116]
MIAEMIKTGDGAIARYERHWRHSVQEVWAWLTENDKISQWFSELRVEELREEGAIVFQMPDGTMDKLTISELKTYSVLEFSWWENTMRFELSPEADGCRLVLTEKLKEITDHTPKDLAGWHVCLEVIDALLDGRTIDSRFEEWKIWYEKYNVAVKNFSSVNAG